MTFLGIRAPKLRSNGRHGETLPAEHPLDEARAMRQLRSVTLAAPPADLPVRDHCDLRPRFIPHQEPKPFTSTPHYQRDVSQSLRRDYAELPLFRRTARDRFTLHQLAMRIPHNEEAGTAQAATRVNATPFRDQADLALKAALDAIDLTGSCAACTKAATTWCDLHEGERVLAEEAAAVIRLLEVARNDGEARAIMRGWPELAGLLDEPEAVAA